MNDYTKDLIKEFNVECEKFLSMSEEDFKKVAEIISKEMKKSVDLRGADLKGVDLKDADLKAVDFLWSKYKI